VVGADSVLGMAAPHVPSSPFSVAVGRESGLTDWQLRTPALFKPTRGVRTLAPPEGLVDRSRAVGLVLPPGAAFSHLTAAQLHGLPLSYAMEEDTRLHVIHDIEAAQIRRAGVVGHRALHPRETRSVDGLPVVGLADTWVDLGELVGRGKPVGIDDLIVVGDACATVLKTRAPLRAALAKRIRPRGKKTLVEALEYIRVGSWSPRETTCRLMFVRAGLPEPELNQPIFASWNPRLLLGYGDLVWRIELPDGRVIKVIGEYQGKEFHESDEQRAHDEARRELFEADDWLVLEIWHADVDSTQARRETVRRFARELLVPFESLDLHAAEPRFFSRHAMELAFQRNASRRW
jgi:hypothetical protein